MLHATTALRRLVLGLVLAMTSAAFSGYAAFADGTGGVSSDAGSTGGGYQVSVHLSGEAAPGGGSGGSASVSVPATCWWQSFGNQVGFMGPDFKQDDPSTWVAWYDYEWKTGNSGSFKAGNLAMGSRDMWVSAAAKATAGEDLNLYTASCADDDDGCKVRAYVGGVAKHDDGGDWNVPGWGACGFALTYAFYPAGAEPTPQVDTETLAKAAYDNIVLPTPDVDRNPHVDAVDGATLVGTPTYFWVLNQASLGGADHTSSITASVEPGGRPSATVTATNDGLLVASDTGSVQCDAAQALRDWRAQQGTDHACEFAPIRSSVDHPGGFQVDASVTWSATWTGSDGKRGDFGTRAPIVDTMRLPVAEVQSLVTTQP